MIFLQGIYCISIEVLIRGKYVIWFVYKDMVGIKPYTLIVLIKTIIRMCGRKNNTYDSLTGSSSSSFLQF